MKWRNLVDPVRDEEVCNVQVFCSSEMNKKV